MALFGSSRPAPQRIGCFGKLPSYGDFLSFGVDSPEAQAFVTWLQDGAASSAVPSFAPDQLVQMVWQPGGTRRTLAIVLWPSGDAAGRRFPFALFTSLPSGFVERHGPRALVAADGTWRALRDIRPAVVKAPRPADLYGYLRELQAPLPPEDREVNRAYVDRAQASQFRRDEFVPVGLHVQDLVWFAENLGGTSDPRFALRMRLHGVTDPVAEGATWLHVLSDRLGLGTLDAALAIRTARAEGGAVFAFRRPLGRDDLSFLLAPGADYRNTDHVGYRVAPSGAADTAFLERFQRAWNQRTPSCATVLEAGAQGWTPGELATGPVELSESDPPSLREIPAAAQASEPAPPTIAPEVTTGRVYEAEPVTDPHPVLSPAAVVAAADAARNAAAPPVTHAAVEQATGEIVPAPQALGDRIRDLVRRPMMRGRVVRFELGGAQVAVLADGSSVRPLPGADPAAVEAVERRTRDHDEAVRLVEELEKIHRATEAGLRAAIEDACDRTGREERRA